MQITGEYIFDAPQTLVWQALQDPDVLASVMPGGEDFQEVAENEYAGNLKVKIGPVLGRFKGKIKLTDIVAPESYRIEVDCKGAPGFVRATGSLKLTGQEAQTHMEYEGDAQIGGRIDIDVAVAGSVDHKRNRCLRFDRRDQAGPAPGDQQVDPLLGLHELFGTRPGGVLDDLNGVSGQAL